MNLTGLQVAQARHDALEQQMWDSVTWTFKIKPDGPYKEGRIIAEWPGGNGRLERIFNTRDARKMTMFEWIAYNQSAMIEDILTRLENKYGNGPVRAPRETDSSSPRLPS